MDLLFLKIMKIKLNKFRLLILLLFWTLFTFAQTPPPPPGEPPPVLPIGEFMGFVVFLTLIFGIYIIYNFKIKQKTPM
jgi:hypothetical protein